MLDELGQNHPAPDHLLDAFRATFDGLVSFIRAHHIVTIPSDVRPIVEETPPFMRATTFASMDTPGPFETHATEAYFNVTLPDPKMTPAEVEGYMHSFNVGTVISTAVHEAYPGHYIQFLWVPKAPSRVRKLLGANTDVEGWAHYCEQMMLDEGYGQPGAGAKDERESKFLRLGQLQDALLRNARFIVGIQMHTGKTSLNATARGAEPAASATAWAATACRWVRRNPVVPLAGSPKAKWMSPSTPDVLAPAASNVSRIPSGSQAHALDTSRGRKTGSGQAAFPATWLIACSSRVMLSTVATASPAQHTTPTWYWRSR